MKDIGFRQSSSTRSWAIVLLALSSTFYVACLDDRDENAGGFGPAAGAGGATASAGAAGKSGAAGATAGAAPAAAGEAGEGGSRDGG